jgi:hypothetical protein
MDGKWVTTPGEYLIAEADRGYPPTDWVIMPVDCPVCVVADEQAADLPDELRADVTVVRTGAELLQVIGVQD